jgi:hypothetical protein
MVSSLNITEWDTIYKYILDNIGNVDIEIIFSLLILYVLENRYQDKLTNLKLIIKKINNTVDQYFNNSGIHRKDIIAIFVNLPVAKKLIEITSIIFEYHTIKYYETIDFKKMKFLKIFDILIINSFFNLLFS